MSDEGLSEVQSQLLATYGGTNLETFCRELTAIDDPSVDPDFRPFALGGLPWWTMKIPKARKYRPLLEKAWEEGFDAGERDAFDLLEHPDHECIKNPYRKEQTNERLHPYD